MVAKLSNDAIEQALQAYEGWSHAQGVLEKVYTFGSFDEAFGFMTRVAIMAEKLDHHPDWSNSYRRVHVSLSTHDVGGITEKDIRLLGFMEQVAAGGT